MIHSCPADNGTSVVDNHPWLPFVTGPTMFAVYESSYFYRTEIAFRYLTSTSFQLPADVNVLFDAAGHWHGARPRLERTDDGATVQDKLRNARYNTLYGDMHTKSLTFDQLQTAWSVPLQ